MVSGAGGTTGARGIVGVVGGGVGPGDASPPEREKISTTTTRAAPRAAPGGRAARRLDSAHGLVLRDAEGRAAAAGRDDVRVVDLEAGALQGVDVVDDRA